MQPPPKVTPEQRQILDVLLTDRVVTGPDLVKRVRAADMGSVRKALDELVQQNLIQVSGSVNDEWGVLSSTFSIRPSDQAYVRPALSLS